MGKRTFADFERYLGWPPGKLIWYLYGDRTPELATALFLRKKLRINLESWLEPPNPAVAFVLPALRAAKPPAARRRKARPAAPPAVPLQAGEAVQGAA